MGKWADSAALSIDKSIEPYNQAYRKAILKIYRLIVKSTPVDEGEHRRAWYIVKGTEPGPIYEDGGPGDGLGPVDEITINDAFTIYNAMGISAVVLELGEYPNPGKEHKRYKKGQPAILTTPDGFSIQAPAGIVGVNVTRIKQILMEEFGKAAKVAA